MNDLVGGFSAYQSRNNNACAALTSEEFSRVVAAAEMYVSSRLVLGSFITALGDIVERGLRRIPPDWQDQIRSKIREALALAQRASLLGMDDDPGRPAHSRTYLGAVFATGVGGGAGGLASLIAELPITTELMLRSIADIGRAHGERLDDPLFRQTCIEVFAYGSPTEEDDEELAFLAARVGALDVAEAIAKIAIRYTAVLGPKIAVMSVPVIGAASGAAVNFAYLTFYHSIARVLFTLLPIERKHDPAQVRSCFTSIVREMREPRHNGRL